jgi:hypothetical protein
MVAVWSTVAAGQGRMAGGLVTGGGGARSLPVRKGGGEGGGGSRAARRQGADGDGVQSGRRGWCAIGEEEEVVGLLLGWKITFLSIFRKGNRSPTANGYFRR